MKRIISIIFGVVMGAGFPADATVLVGGAMLNGNFNLPGTAGAVNFAAEPHWVNIGGNQSANFLNDIAGNAFDGTHYAQLSEQWVPSAGLDTGHTIAAGDVFDVSYQWRDGWQWDIGVDQMKVRLFVTHNNLISGTQTTLASALSGTSTLNGTYELVDQDEFYTAGTPDRGKKLFVAIEIQGGATLDSYGQMDNFTLTVSGAVPTYADIDITIPSAGTLEVSFDTLSNHVYTLETTTNLLSNTWINRTTVGPVPSNGLQTLSYADPAIPDYLFGRVNFYYQLYQVPTIYSAQYVPAGYGSTPLFEDQFNGVLDTSIWTEGLKGPGNDLVPGASSANLLNNKYHCSFEPDDSYTENGSLVLRGRDRNVRGRVGGYKYDYTAGWVMSMHQFSFNKGYMEFRAKFPKGDKVWPAIWLIAEDLIWGPEIDIFEYFGYRPDHGSDVMHCGVFSTEYPASEWDSDFLQPFAGTYGTDVWHVYGFEWTSTYCRFFIDGVQVGQVNSSEVNSGIWPNEEMYIVINNGARRDSSDSTTIWPNYFEIDYLEVYQTP